MSGFFVVFLGAGLGGALRQGVNLATLRLFGAAFPYGTITVNVVGSLVMGLLAGWFAQKADPGQAWRLFLTTGVLGGFTTFSTFSLDTFFLWERGQIAVAFLYVLASLVLGLIGLFLGLFLVRSLA